MNCASARDRISLRAKASGRFVFGLTGLGAAVRLPARIEQA
jgi:hypothetical protein